MERLLLLLFMGVLFFSCSDSSIDKESNNTTQNMEQRSLTSMYTDLINSSMAAAIGILFQLPVTPFDEPGQVAGRCAFVIYLPRFFISLKTCFHSSIFRHIHSGFCECSALF